MSRPQRYALYDGVTVTVVPRVGVRVEDDVNIRFTFVPFAAASAFTCSLTPVHGNANTSAVHIAGCNIEMVGPTKDAEVLYRDVYIAHETYCEHARQTADNLDGLDALFGARAVGGKWPRK